MITTLGVDPGLTCGFLLARWEPGWKQATWRRAFQADMGSAVYLLEMLLDSKYGTSIDAAQVEAYDSRLRSGRTTGVSARTMQDLIAELENELSLARIKTHVRQVGNVEPWATSGDRMSRAGLVLPAKMTDATSAGWHALYTACRDCGMPDPARRERSHAHPEPGPGAAPGTG